MMGTGTEVVIVGDKLRSGATPRLSPQDKDKLVVVEMVTGRSGGAQAIPKPPLFHPPVALQGLAVTGSSPLAYPDLQS